MISLKGGHPNNLRRLLFVDGLAEIHDSALPAAWVCLITFELAIALALSWGMILTVKNATDTNLQIRRFGNPNPMDDVSDHHSAKIM